MRSPLTCRIRTRRAPRRSFRVTSVKGGGRDNEGGRSGTRCRRAALRRATMRRKNFARLEARRVRTSELSSGWPASSTRAPSTSGAHSPTRAPMSAALSDTYALCRCPAWTGCGSSIEDLYTIGEATCSSRNSSAWLESARSSWPPRASRFPASSGGRRARQAAASHAPGLPHLRFVHPGDERGLRSPLGVRTAVAPRRDDPGALRGRWARCSQREAHEHGVRVLRVAPERGASLEAEPAIQRAGRLEVRHRSRSRGSASGNPSASPRRGCARGASTRCLSSGGLARCAST